MGWVGIMMGNIGAMTNGSVHRVTVTDTYNSSVVDLFASHAGKPNATKTTIVTGSSGLSDPNFVEASFVRPLATSADQHYSIPPAPGTKTNVSLAFSNVTFEFHGKNAQFMPDLDLAAIAQGNMESISFPFTTIDAKEGETLIGAMRRHSTVQSVSRKHKRRTKA